MNDESSNTGSRAESRSRARRCSRRACSLSALLLAATALYQAAAVLLEQGDGRRRWAADRLVRPLLSWRRYGRSADGQAGGGGGGGGSSSSSSSSDLLDLNGMVRHMLRYPTTSGGGRGDDGGDDDDREERDGDDRGRGRGRPVSVGGGNHCDDALPVIRLSGEGLQRLQRQRRGLLDASNGTSSSSGGRLTFRRGDLVVVNGGQHRQGGGSGRMVNHTSPALSGTGWIEFTLHDVRFFFGVGPQRSFTEGREGRRNLNAIVKSVTTGNKAAVTTGTLLQMGGSRKRIKVKVETSSGKEVAGDAAAAPAPAPAPAPAAGERAAAAVSAPPVLTGELCYHGATVDYTTNTDAASDGGGAASSASAGSQCRGPVPTAAKSVYKGGNSYYLRLVGPAIVWAPVRDNRDGTYAVRVRVDDPGAYRVTVYAGDTRRGCAYADCDAPPDVCRLAGGSEGKSKCSQADRCMALVSTLTLVVAEGGGRRRRDGRDEGGGGGGRSESSRPWRPPGSLPSCTAAAGGIAHGRWVSRDWVQRGPRSVPTSDLFVDPTSAVPWPWVWMPYGCSLRWPRGGALSECINGREWILMGMSRERTNFFDLEEWGDVEFEYFKRHGRMRSEGSAAIALLDAPFWSQGKDVSVWNTRPDRMTIGMKVQEQIRNLRLCASDTDTNSSLPVHAFVTEDVIRPATWGLRSAWPSITNATIQSVFRACPDARVVYKTGVALTNGVSTLSFERMYEQTREAARVAVSLGLPVVDAFSITAPLIVDPSIYPDADHLYTNISFQGNFASRTTSMLFVRHGCPHM